MMAPYSCDIKEIVSTTADGKVYELVNLANGEAQVFADCIPEDLAGAITHRYATVSYKDIEADYSSQFVYFLGDSNSFPFLNDWVGLADDHTTRNMKELIAAFEQLPYRYEDKTPEPEASAWYKTQIVTDNQGVTTTTSYNDQGVAESTRNTPMERIKPSVASMMGRHGLKPSSGVPVPLLGHKIFGALMGSF